MQQQTAQRSSRRSSRQQSATAGSSEQAAAERPKTPKQWHQKSWKSTEIVLKRAPRRRLEDDLGPHRHPNGAPISKTGRKTIFWMHFGGQKDAKSHPKSQKIWKNGAKIKNVCIHSHYWKKYCEFCACSTHLRAFFCTRIPQKFTKKVLRDSILRAQNALGDSRKTSTWSLRSPWATKGSSNYNFWLQNYIWDGFWWPKGLQNH